MLENNIGDMLKNNVLFVAILGLVSLSSCDPSRVFEANKQLAEATWKQNEPVSIEAEITDTLTYNSIYINVRNKGGYQYSNLFLFIKTTTPKGNVGMDTLECTLANPDGKWLGSGLGDIYSNQILFKKNVRFGEKGKYTFDIGQAMRIDPLTEIMDVGIRIEKAQ